MSKLELGLGSFLPQFFISSAACKIWHCENQSTMGWDDLIPCSIHLSEIQFHQNLLIIGGCPVVHFRANTFLKNTSFVQRCFSPVTRPPEPGTVMNNCFRRFSFFRIICVFLGSVIAPEM